MSYNADGSRTEIAYPNGVHECLVYDDAQRLIQVEGVGGTGAACAPAISGTLLTNVTYGYSGAGGYDTDMRQQMTAQYQGGSATTTYFCYDTLNRLISADTGSLTCPNASATYQYSYDADANLVSKTISGTTTSYSHNAANELTGTGFSYDGNGSQTNDSGTFSSATYNPADQMREWRSGRFCAEAQVHRQAVERHRWPRARNVW